MAWWPPDPQLINGINQGYKLQAWRGSRNLKNNCCQIISLNLILVSEGNNTIPEKTVAVPPSLFDPLAEQSALLEGILKYTDYQVTVLCFTSPGDGPRSAPVSVKTAEDGSCHLHEI